MKVSEMFLTPDSSAPLGDVTPVIFLHRIAESVSPPNLIILVCSDSSSFFYLNISFAYTVELLLPIF